MTGTVPDGGAVTPGALPGLRSGVRLTGGLFEPDALLCCHGTSGRCLVLQ